MPKSQPPATPNRVFAVLTARGQVGKAPVEWPWSLRLVTTDVLAASEAARDLIKDDPTLDLVILGHSNLSYWWIHWAHPVGSSVQESLRLIDVPSYMGPAGYWDLVRQMAECALRGEEEPCPSPGK